MSKIAHFSADELGNILILHFTEYDMYLNIYKKGKVIPLQARCGPEGG